MKRVEKICVFQPKTDHVLEIVRDRAKLAIDD